MLHAELFFFTKLICLCFSILEANFWQLLKKLELFDVVGGFLLKFVGLGVSFSGEVEMFRGLIDVLVEAEADVFYFELVLVLSEVIIKAAWYFGFSLDSLIAIEEHRRWWF